MKAYILIVFLLAFGTGILVYKYDPSSGPQSKPIVLEPVRREPQVSDIDLNVLFERTNQERVQAGLSVLSLDNRLNASAAEKCNHMVANKYFEHKAPDGTDWSVFVDKHIKYRQAGENLAEAQQSAPQVVREWMASPTHKANILNAQWDSVGFAVCDTMKPAALGLQTKVLFTVQHFADL